MFARLLLCALLAGVFGVANAQNKPTQAQPQAQGQKARQQLTPQQRAAIQKRNKELVDYANHVVYMVDAGQEAQVWDAMSEVGKKAVARDKFVSAVQEQRKSLGKVKSRKVATLYGLRSDGKDLPTGIYMNVLYVTRFTGSEEPKIELVSFHLDSDRKWRVSGYVCKDMPKPTAQAAQKK
jgi:hypothetical protein